MRVSHKGISRRARGRHARGARACVRGGQDHRDRADGPAHAAVVPDQPLPGGLPDDGLPGQGRHQARADGRARRRQDRRLVDHARLARASARSSSSTTTTAARRRPASRSSSRARSCSTASLGQSPLQSLQPYFGTTVQFPLGARAERARRATSIGADGAELGARAGARDGQRHLVAGEPRARNACAEPGTQSAQLDLRDLAQYRCLYRTARLTYSATLITTPTPPKKQAERRHAQALEQRRDDLRVELACRTCRAARRPRRAATSPRGRAAW